MTEESRREWLAVAWKSLDHLPADILAIGCAKARQTCDHPSKIVPTIIAETKEMLGWRREAVSNSLALPPPVIKKHVMDRDRSTFTAADWAELNEHLEKMGSLVRYQPDGTRFEIRA